jgi:nuclear pore complex protein Nup98-Nup96
MCTKFVRNDRFFVCQSHRPAANTLPPWQQTPSKRELSDTCFHLMKLYCDSKYPIADIVSPSCHSSNQLDYRLSWHLAMALLSLNYSYVSRECLATLHESYAVQLQSFGLWHWAVFILMHIDDTNR